MTIVVGVDGSVSALDATRWAAAEAKARGLPLRLVHACVLPPLRHKSGADTVSRWLEELLDTGHQVLERAAAAAHEVDRTVVVEVDQRVGGAVEVLIEESTRARSVVLGCRGLGGFEGMLAGSVAVAVSGHATCPVVVVRGRDLDEPPPASGAVVVGVDGSPVSEAAIAWAFDAASLWRAPLVAVHTWTDTAFTGVVTALPSMIDWSRVEADERRLLDERLAGWSEKYPDVAVERVVVRDRATRVLLDAAERARVVVVGSRGHGRIVGLALGSTSQTLLHHAPCPVVVVRP